MPGFQSDRLRRAGTPSHNLKLEDETKCQVEFHDLCVHRSYQGEGRF
ncbi:hypothetical protein [Anabaena sp. CCY 9614]